MHASNTDHLTFLHFIFLITFGKAYVPVLYNSEVQNLLFVCVCVHACVRVCGATAQLDLGHLVDTISKSHTIRHAL